MSEYFTYPPLTAATVARAADVNSRFMGVSTGFDKLPPPAYISEDRVTFAVDTGVANAYVVNPILPISAYTLGLRLSVQATNPNSGPSTINVSGLGVKQIIRSDSTALEHGDIVAGQMLTMVYDGFAFQLAMAFAEISPSGIKDLIEAAGDIDINGDLTVNDEPYGPDWNASLQVPTKNATYDEMETRLKVADDPAWDVTPNSSKYYAGAAHEGSFAVGNVEIEGAARFYKAGFTGAGAWGAALELDQKNYLGGMYLEIPADGISGPVKIHRFGVVAGYEFDDAVKVKGDVVIDNAGADGISHANLHMGNYGTAFLSDMMEMRAGVDDPTDFTNIKFKDNTGVVRAQIWGGNATDHGLYLDGDTIHFENANETVQFGTIDATGINIPTGATYKINGVTIGGGALTVSDTVYGPGWNGITTVAPSQNAVYDQMELRLPAAPYAGFPNWRYIPLDGFALKGGGTTSELSLTAPATGNAASMGVIASYAQNGHHYTISNGSLSGVLNVTFETTCPVAFNNDIKIDGGANGVTTLAKPTASIVGFVGGDAASGGWWMQGPAPAGGHAQLGGWGTVNGIDFMITGTNRLVLTATLLASTVPITVPDDPYAAGWDGNFQVPTKNAVYDKIQTLGAAGVSSFNSRTGAVTLTSADVTTALTFTPANVVHTHAAADIVSGTLAPARMPALTGDITTAVGTVNTTLTDGAVSYAKIQSAAANTVLCRASGSAGPLAELVVGASTLVGRGSTGNLAACTLGASLSFAGSVLSVLSVPNLLTFNASNAGDVAGSTYNGGAAVVVSANTVGALPLTPRQQSVGSAATVTPTFLNDIVIITAQAVGLTLANWSGTAVANQGMVIRIKDSGTSQTIAYGTQYRAIGLTAPVATVPNKTLYLGCIWNATDSKIDIVSVAQE